jgi:uncharacterized protein DUF6790
MAPASILGLAYQVVVLVGFAAQVAAQPKARTARGAVAALLRWSLAVNIGVAGLMAAFAHTARAAETARSIGWAPGSPFQFEVAMANLGFGIAGLLCVWLAGLFWWATAIASGTFLLGAAYGHIRDILVNGNRAPGNAGVILYTDILVPVVHLVLLIVLARLDRPIAARPRG